MSDDIRTPIGTPPNGGDRATEGEVNEEDYEDVEDMNEAISDDPTLEKASERKE